MKDQAPTADGDRKFQRSLGLMLLLAYFALVLAASSYALWFHVIHGMKLSSDVADWAMFGDFLGGTVGPFIGFASVFLLVKTLQLQRRGLQEQREHLQQSADEIKQQNRILFLQGFEQSFFSWLKDYKEQTDALLVEIDSDPMCDEPGGTLRGRQALSHVMDHCYQLFDFADALYMAAAQRLRTRSNDITQEDIDMALKKVSHRWKRAMNSYADSLGSMLRTLYGLFRWIDEHSQLSNGEKRHYASIVRARLSNAELRMLFINGMTQNGQKFAVYINKYSLFDNLPDPDRPLLDALRKHPQCPYAQAAYKTEPSEKD